MELANTKAVVVTARGEAWGWGCGGGRAAADEAEGEGGTLRAAERWDSAADGRGRDTSSRGGAAEAVEGVVVVAAECEAEALTAAAENE